MIVAASRSGPARAQVVDDPVGRLVGRQAREPAVLGVEAPGLVDRREHRQAELDAQLEVVAPGAGGDVDDPRALPHRDLGPRDRRGGRPRRRARARRTAPRSASRPSRLPSRVSANGSSGAVNIADPVAVGRQAVLELRVHRRGDVRRQRPRRRRPDHERLAGALEQRQAHPQRRMRHVLVDAGLRQLVLRQRRAAARAPLRRAVAEKQPAALVDDLQEAPDVLDVRVREREVVVAPVHPLAEALGRARELARRPLDDLAALGRELLQAVLLDLVLGVQPERLLDPDLDPQALAVPAVLVALVEALQRLVALEDVLQRAAPGRVDAHPLVRRDRAVDEAEPRPAAVGGAQLLERVPLLPQLEDRLLEARVIGDRRKLGEPAGHGEAVYERHLARARSARTPLHRATEGVSWIQRSA